MTSSVAMSSLSECAPQLRVGTCETGEQEGFLYREFQPWLFATAEIMTIEFFRLLAKLVGDSNWTGDKRRCPARRGTSGGSLSLR